MASILSLVAGGEIRAAFEPPAPEVRGTRWRLPGELPAPPAPTLSEIFAPSARDGGATGFLLGQIDARRPLLWVQQRMAMLEAGRIYPPGLSASGFPLGDIIHVEARDARAVLWAMEEGLRCSGLGAVIGETWGDPKALDFTATRRLAVAAERHGVAAWLLRLGGSANLSGARMRWRVTSGPSLAHPLNRQAPGGATWAAELFRARGLSPGVWNVSHEAAGETDHVDLAATDDDRAVVADRGGQGVA